MRFVLRYGLREVELPVGRFVVGRAEDCELYIDDAQASRHHAAFAVSEGEVVVEDLESRNGVRVNGDRIHQRRRIVPGDSVTIGQATLQLMLERDPMTETMEAVSQPLAAFGLIGVLADKALQLGRGEEAERLIGPQLEQILADVKAGRPVDPATLDQASSYAIRLTSVTSNSRWLDVVFEVHRRLRRPCSAPLVEELYVVMRRVKHPHLRELRAYLDVLREIQAGLGPAERFVVGRLEGLTRLIG